MPKIGDIICKKAGTNGGVGRQGVVIEGAFDNEVRYKVTKLGMGDDKKNIKVGSILRCPDHEVTLVRRAPKTVKAVKPEPTLEEQQAKAKAELDRINALIAERDSPKVGDRFYNNTHSSDKPGTFEILLIEGSYAVCRMSNCFQPERPQVYPLSLFKENHISRCA